MTYFTKRELEFIAKVMREKKALDMKRLKLFGDSPLISLKSEINRAELVLAKIGQRKKINP